MSEYSAYEDRRERERWREMLEDGDRGGEGVVEVISAITMKIIVNIKYNLLNKKFTKTS